MWRQSAKLSLVKNSFLAYFVSRTILAVTDHIQQHISPDFSRTTLEFLTIPCFPGEWTGRPVITHSELSLHEQLTWAKAHPSEGSLTWAKAHPSEGSPERRLTWAKARPSEGSPERRLARAKAHMSEGSPEWKLTWAKAWPVYQAPHPQSNILPCHQPLKPVSHSSSHWGLLMTSVTRDHQWTLRSLHPSRPLKQSTVIASNS